MQLQTKYEGLVSEYNLARAKSSRGEKVSRLDLEFKEGALNAIEQAKNVFNQTLDLTEESIRIVEMIMDELHSSVIRFNPSETWIECIIKMYAGYIGYVACARWSGEWRPEIEYPIKRGPVLKIDAKDFFVPYHVRLRLLRGKEYNLCDYFRFVKCQFEENFSAIFLSGDNYPKCSGKDWIIGVQTVNQTDYFTIAEIGRIFNFKWRCQAGFAKGIVDIYGLAVKDGRWYCLDEDNALPELFSRLEVRCNLIQIYQGKHHLNPRYLEVYFRTVYELFSQFPFEVAVIPYNSFDEGVTYIKTKLSQDTHMQEIV